MEKLKTEYYKKYVGDYAKRFYTSFEKDNMAKIVGFKLDDQAYFLVENHEGKWYWDVEDCVVITNESNISDDERVANIKYDRYLGYNPFN